MPRTIRFHLDEHISHAIAEGLRQRSIDVTTTSDANLIGATDEEHIVFAQTHRRVCFTQDHDFLIFAASGGNHAGIVYCSQGSRSIGQVLRALELIWEIYESTDMTNRVEFI